MVMIVVIDEYDAHDVDVEVGADVTVDEDD